MGKSPKDLGPCYFSEVDVSIVRGRREEKKKTPPQIKTVATLSHLASRRKKTSRKLRKLLKSYRTLDTLCPAPPKKIQNKKINRFYIYLKKKLCIKAKNQNPVESYYPTPDITLIYKEKRPGSHDTLF